jgi:hypothetical protein
MMSKSFINEQNVMTHEKQLSQIQLNLVIIKAKMYGMYRLVITKFLCNSIYPTKKVDHLINKEILFSSLKWDSFFSLMSGPRIRQSNRQQSS